MNRRGSSLIELLVVLSVFSGLMVVILSFYIYATKVSHSRDRVSVSYRKMVTALDKVETLLAGSKIHFLDGRQIVYSKVDRALPYLPGAWPHFAERAETIAVISDRKGTYLVTRKNGASLPLLEIQSGESMVFQQTTDRVLVTVTVELPDEQGAGVRRSYTTSRSIITERF